MTDKEFIKFRKLLFDRLILIGMINKTSNNSCEKYWSGFATVCLSIDREHDQLYIERYYDNELLDNEFNQNFIFAFDQLDAAVAKCKSLIRTVRNEEPLLNGGE
jgi:hypothetical protein